ncbi:MAG: sigma 54-interacting transcriptional regulator, partial [bacterium]
VTDREGAFQYADGGTLFLDEVGDMPMSTQIKLLRVLEEHQITRVGDNKPIKINVRLISATNRPLEKMIDDGLFRNDLYYRIKVVTVHLPPLRERRDDIIPLMDH